MHTLSNSSQPNIKKQTLSITKAMINNKKVIISPSDERAKNLLAGLDKLKKDLIKKFEHTNLAFMKANRAASSKWWVTMNYYNYVQEVEQDSFAYNFITTGGLAYTVVIAPNTYDSFFDNCF